MKKIISIFFMLLIANHANAEGFFDKTFFGVAFISQSAELETTTTGTTTSISETGSGIGLYLDKYLSRKYRFNSTLSYVTYDAFDVGQLMISADYLIPLNARVSFFGGVAAGGAIQTFSDASFSDGAVGAVYGAQLGGILFLNNSLMLELGYRFRPTSGIDTVVLNPADTITSVTDLSEAYFSVLFMF